MADDVERFVRVLSCVRVRWCFSPLSGRVSFVSDSLNQEGIALQHCSGATLALATAMAGEGWFCTGFLLLCSFTSQGFSSLQSSRAQKY